MTPLHSTLKRALTIDGREYVLTLTQDALKLTLKGKRNGVELPWGQLVNGEAALAVALHASLGAFATKPEPADATPPSRTSPSPAQGTSRSAARARRAKKLTRKRPARKK
jgi:hypothetical protein